MKTWIYILGIISYLFLFGACSEDTLTPTTNNPPSSGSGDQEWLIPSSEVRDGGPGKDGIPAINAPNFSVATTVDFLDPADLVIVIKTPNGIKAYPHVILDWHEIVNDAIADELNLSLTYCPLTGTAIGWDSKIDGKVTTFGVSGLLYNSNLMPYDRATDSYWSQMSHKCVNGELVGTEAKTFHVVEMAFSTLQSFYPEALVLNRATGFSRNYGRYPYGDYKTNHSSLFFPVSNTDTRLPNKERVLGVVINEEVLIYGFDVLGATGINLVQNNFNNADLVVIGSQDLNILTAYKGRLSDGTLLVFEPVQNAYPIIMQDQEGNRWDIFGQALEGPRAGEKLPKILNYIGYWFSWAAFNENLQIYSK